MIPCDECRQRPASVHVTRIVGGRKRERNLCERCALEKGELPFAWEPHPLQELLTGMLAPSPQDLRCPACGLTYGEFARTGLLGCSACYATFHEQLTPVLRRVHGADRHRGKRPVAAGAPGPTQDAARLRDELREAVEREEYEKAAALRDRLRGLGA